MAIELHGENFQSWEKFDLTLDGLSVVVGPSNLGKSAIFRSLMGLVRNSLGEAQIRRGSDGIRIEAVIDGHRIIATRPKKGSVSYEFDGEPFEKLDGAVPEKVADLGMGELRIGKVKLDPVFAKQFGRPFMLEEGDAAMNTILGAFSSTEKLENGKREANRRIAERNSEAKVIAKSLREVEERKAKLEPLATRATEIQAEIDRLEPKVARGEKLVTWLDSLIVHREKLDRLEKALGALHVPDLAPTAHGIQTIAAVTALESCKTRHERLRQVLDRLVIPDVGPATALRDTARHSHAAYLSTQRMNKAREAKAAIDICVVTWTEIVNLFKQVRATEEAERAVAAHANSQIKQTLEELDQHTGKIDGLIFKVTSSSERIKRLDALIASREAINAKVASLAALGAELAEAQARVESIRAEHQKHQQEQAIAAHQAAVRMAIEDHKCPACGEPLPA